MSQLVSTAWASAASFRGTDKRGGANGARIRLAPQMDWAVNDPAALGQVLGALEQVQAEFNGSQNGGARVSLADLIVLAGCAGVEQAARSAGHDVEVPFCPRAHRRDAGMDRRGVVRRARTHRGRVPQLPPGGAGRRPEDLLVERAYMLTLTAPEMTVLVGGLRALNANTGQTPHGVLTDRPGELTNDFFVNLLDMSTEWTEAAESDGVFEGRDSQSGELKWTGTRVDLVFGSNSELRALAEVYACNDAQETFVRDFVSAWTKVMNLDRYDLA